MDTRDRAELVVLCGVMLLQARDEVLPERRVDYVAIHDLLGKHGRYVATNRGNGVFLDVLDQHVSRGWLTLTKDHYSLTPSGLARLNDLQTEAILKPVTG
jgi:hypothetical protein